MNNIRLINFINLTNKDKEMILLWRNNDIVRKWMYTQEIITLENHSNYIESLVTKSDRLYFLVKQENEKIGVIDFTSIDLTNNSAEIGLYANPNIKGMGKLLMSSILDYGFNELKLNKLFANVLNTNIKAIELYKKYNFTTLDEKDNIIYMELKNENR